MVTKIYFPFILLILPFLLADSLEVQNNIYITSCHFDQSNDLIFGCSEYFNDTNFFDQTPSSYCDNVEAGKNKVNGIRFTDCHLPAVPSDLFTLYPNVSSLRIEASSLESLRGPDLINGHTLNRLEVPFNKLTEISAFLFAEAKNVKDINLSNNQINLIDPQAFIDVTKVQLLDLSSNEIPYLPERLFNHFKEECTIYLQENHIVNIHVNTFAGGSGIAWLNLSKNQITTIHAHAFDDLVNLEFLDLSNNPISRFDSGLFARLTKLVNLHITHTGISAVDFVTFTQIPKLKYLDLSNNQLRNIQFNQTLTPLAQLHSFRLFDNQLRSLRGFVRKFVPKLQYLGIAGNKFSCVYLENFFDAKEWIDRPPRFTRPHPDQPNEIQASDNECFGYVEPEPVSWIVEDWASED